MRRKYGTGKISKRGYLFVRRDGRYIQMHRYVAEQALGKPLPEEAVVHHWDRDELNNSNENLLICPDQSYHMLIHARMDAMDATGDPDKRRCKICGCYDDTRNLCKIGSRNRLAHRACAQKAWREAKRKNRGDGDGTEANAETASV